MKDVWTMSSVSKQNPFHYCIFGIHENGRWCYEWKADTLEVARGECRRLRGLGWCETAIYYDGKPVS